MIFLWNHKVYHWWNLRIYPSYRAQFLSTNRIVNNIKLNSFVSLMLQSHIQLYMKNKSARKYQECFSFISSWRKSIIVDIIVNIQVVLILFLQSLERLSPATKMFTLLEYPRLTNLNRKINLTFILTNIYNFFNQMTDFVLYFLITKYFYVMLVSHLRMSF